MKDTNKLVEEKAKELWFQLGLPQRNMYMSPRFKSLKAFIRTIVEEMDDKYWAQEQYYLETIKDLQKQLNEVKK